MSIKILLIFLGLGVLSCSAAVPLDQPYNPQDFFNSRIVNGTVAPEGYAPHMAALVVGGRMASLVCGACIVSYDYTVTAAHCIDAVLSWQGHLLDSLRGVIGTNRWSDQRNVIRFSGYQNHPEWNRFTIKNDVGLLRMAQKLKPSKGVGVIALNFKFIGGGQLASVTGWGTTSLWGSIPDKLQLLYKETISPERCEEEMRKAQAQWGHMPQVNATVEICTMHKRGAGNGMCHGDSGSGLVDEAGQLIGIVSWGVPCAMGAPDMFARISGFRNFFQSVLGREFVDAPVE